MRTGFYMRCGNIVTRNSFDFIAPERYAYKVIALRFKNFQRIAFYAELTGFGRSIVALILYINKAAQQIIAVDLVTGTYGHTHIGVIFGRTQTVNT